MRRIKVYLDNCCFNRPFDDQRQLRIFQETQAKLLIQSLIAGKGIEMLWSYMLELENRKNPYENKRLSIAGFSSHAISFVNRSDSVSELADQCTAKGLRTADALHLACAVVGGADHFITTDDKLLKFQSNMPIVDPIAFVKFLDEPEEK